MTNKKLLEILTLVNSVSSNRWTDVIKIVKFMPSIEIKEKKWFGKFGQDYSLDLCKAGTWSTYDQSCIELVFSNNNNKFICEASIYDGNNLDGRRKNLRFTAKLMLPNSFIEELEEKILYAFDKLAEYSYGHYLENQKELWMSNFKSEILGKA